jgi:hypothetical protein
MTRIIIFLLLLLPMLPHHAVAELMPRFARGFEPKFEKISGVRTYTSGNGVYELVMNVPEGKWSLNKEGRLLWSKYLPNQPGAAAVSDDGEIITQPIWQFVDEVHSYCSGIVFYNKEGEPGKAINFLDGWQSLLLSLDQVAISPEGTMIVIGSNEKQKSALTMINGANGVKKWSITAGYATIDAIRMTSGGAYTLVATHDRLDMEFVLLDHGGNTVWTRRMAGNFSPEIGSYVRFDRDEKAFFVYDLSTRKFQRNPIPVPKAHVPGLG